MIVVRVSLVLGMMVHLIWVEVLVQRLWIYHHWRSKSILLSFVCGVANPTWSQLLHMILVVPGLSTVPSRIAPIECIETWHVTICIDSKEAIVPIVRRHRLCHLIFDVGWWLFPRLRFCFNVINVWVIVCFRVRHESSCLHRKFSAVDVLITQE